MKTKIIATLGPSTESVKAIRGLILAGVNVFRINLSHGEHHQQAALIAAVKMAREQAGKETAILLDTRGPEIRTGDLKGGPLVIEKGGKLVLTSEEIESTAHRVAINYGGIVEDVKSGDRILMDDGNLAVKVESVKGTEIHTRVLVGGKLGSRKRVSLPGVVVNLPPLTEKDVEDIRFGVRAEVDFIAASFVRKGEDVLAVRKVLEEVGGSQQVISKIENQESVDNLEEILELSDGLMIARGDLGVELEPETVPIIQKKIIRLANQMGKPVITATQMLESMINSPRPTRAESSDVANAILDGTDAVMLSGETAVGSYPEQAVRFLVKNGRVSEADLPYDDLLAKGGRYSTQTMTNSICYASCAIANDLAAAAILTATQSGLTARMVSRHRPRTRIIAMSPSAVTRRRMQLYWGVTPFEANDGDSIDSLFDNSIEAAKEKNLLHNGDLVVITAGLPFRSSGSTNMLRIQAIGDIDLHGQGIGTKRVTGRVVIVHGQEDLARVKSGDIIVCYETDTSMVAPLNRVGGVITEQPGLTCHAALVGRELDIPVITGVKNASVKLKEGQTITMDCKYGQIKAFAPKDD
ncbi:MAG: pyruvate kinase [Thermodesulfobacteriota bacterium]